MNVIEVKNLSFTYKTKESETPILKKVDFSIRRGEMVAIKGPSGSGKSTLLYILGGMLSYQSGNVIVLGKDLKKLSSYEKAILRNQKLGFIFQQFHLLPKLNVLENVLLPTDYPLEFMQERKEELRLKKKNQAFNLLKMLKIESKLESFPNKLSGGQQQRVAVARALIHDAEIILADEPTGNLDSISSADLIRHLKELNKQGKTVVIITHDQEIASECDRILTLKDGTLSQEENFSLTIHHNEQNSKLEIVKESSLKWGMFFKIFKIAFKGLFQHKIRSFLTMMGVVVGIAAVLSMVTLGDFTQEKILKSYADLGVNTMVFSGYPNWQMKATDQYSTTFSTFNLEKDIYYLKNVFPQIEKITPILMNWGNSGASYGGISIENEISLMGVNENAAQITNRKIRIGKNLSPFHIESAHAVCIIGDEVYSRLFRNANPLGQIINLNFSQDKKAGCMVIGVFEPQSTKDQWRKPNLEIYVPFTFFANNSGNRWISEHHRFSLMLRPGTDMEKMQKALNNFFNKKYGNSGKFWADSDSGLISQMKKFLTLFAILLTSVAMISLAVGGIGITNMMLVSVSERLKEIGLRKAIGATDQSIRLQYLVESIILCSVAGFIGVVIGIITYESAIYLGSQLIPNLEFEWVFNLKALLISFLSIFFVGVLSGLIPAIKAEKLEVIESLRSE